MQEEASRGKSNKDKGHKVDDDDNDNNNIDDNSN
jgi:hypothetical protein